MTAAVLAMHRVSFAPDGPLRDIDWRVEHGQHWALLGPNGAGKTTLLRIAAGTLEPTAGEVRVLGRRHGAPGYDDPRLRIAEVEGRAPALARQLTALDVAVLRQSGPVALRGERIRDEDVARATELLIGFGCGAVLDRRFGDCSQGERQRILLARALMRDPALLLLDEPATALDMPGRDALRHAMERLAADRPELASITVAHRLEELPASTTHALLLRDGATVAAGPADATLTAPALSAAFGAPVAVSRTAGGWSAAIDQAAAAAG